MSDELTITKVEDKQGKVVVSFVDAGGRELELRLTLFDVSQLVSFMYAARTAAFGQQPEGPSVRLRAEGINFGEDATYALMRVHVNEHHHQDFAAERGTALAEMFLMMGQVLAKLSGRPDVVVPDQGKKH